MAAAFSVTGPADDAQLVVVQEAERQWCSRARIPELEAAVRDMLVQDHGVPVHRVVFVPPGVIPRTTSGKVQRGRTRDLWRQGAFGAVE
jgi:acyl-CoA synthetase (AMP-forming)/AMP-acid ligase II